MFSVLTASSTIDSKLLKVRGGIKLEDRKMSQLSIVLEEVYLMNTKKFITVNNQEIREEDEGILNAGVQWNEPGRVYVTLVHSDSELQREIFVLLRMICWANCTDCICHRQKCLTYKSTGELFLESAKNTKTLLKLLESSRR
jgi:hypothetical protein